MLGFGANELIGKDWIDALVPAERRKQVRAASKRMVRGDTERFTRVKNLEPFTRDGSRRLTSWHNVLIRNERGEITGTLSSGEDVTKRIQIEQKLERNKHRLAELAHHDYLTKLPNRLLFHDRLKHALAQAQRTRDQVAVLLLDLDRFKNINDTLGHHVGDQFLKVIAKRLRSCMRQGDTVARLGGDEFVVVLQKIASGTSP